LYNLTMDFKDGQLPHDRVNQPQDSDKVFFYPKEFYVFDNFSSFQVEYDGYTWPTSEHAYHAAGFKGVAEDVVEKIKNTRSAHDAQKIAYSSRDKQIDNWDATKFDVMKNILRNKIEQHPYVLKKLRQSGDREIVEDSWRDDVWGWGESKKGKNMLGKIWMELREEYR
jgi:ribA/ribD-fused uncharacterized protein